MENNVYIVSVIVNLTVVCRPPLVTPFNFPLKLLARAKNKDD